MATTSPGNPTTRLSVCLAAVRRDEGQEVAVPQPGQAIPVRVTAAPVAGVATISKLVIADAAAPAGADQDTVAVPVVVAPEDAVAVPIVGAPGGGERHGLVGELQQLDVPHGVGTVARLLPHDVGAGLDHPDCGQVASCGGDGGDRVLRPRPLNSAVSVPPEPVSTLPDGHDVPGVDGAGEHGRLQRRAGEIAGGVAQILAGHRTLTGLVGARAADLGGRVGGVGAHAEPNAEVPVTVDDVVGAAALDQVAAAAAEQAVAVTPDRPAEQGTELGRRVGNHRGERGGQRRDRQVQVRVLRLRVAQADLPVVPGGTGDLLDAGPCDTDVVAALPS